MNSIVSFTIPNLAYKCSVNHRGPRKFGTIDELIQSRSGQPSRVGTSIGYMLSTDIRNSTHYKSVFKFAFDHAIAVQSLQTIVAEQNQQFVQWLPEDHKYDLIVYNMGGFFHEHTDVRRHKSHYATLLIFPPATGEFAHPGGDLHITREDGSKFIFSSSINMEWRIIAFHTHLRHECKEVLSGNRIVIKTDLPYSYGQFAEPIEIDDRWHLDEYIHRTTD